MQSELSENALASRAGFAGFPLAVPGDPQKARIFNMYRASKS